MPRNKDLKRLVRARMRRTGESYTASRAKIVAQSAAKTTTVARQKPSVKTPDYAARAGIADAKIKERTGCTWERWVAALDYHGADRMSHRDIALLVKTKYKVGPWWTQTVTVGYERIKGLRARGQQRDGSYEVSKSKTYKVPVAALFAAWSDARLRARWLDNTIGRVRSRSENKSMRLDGSDDSVVVVGFTAKGAGKSAVAIEHSKLKDRAAADALKQYWAQRLDALGQVLMEAQG